MALPFVVLPLANRALVPSLARSTANGLHHAATAFSAAFPEPDPPAPLPLLPQAEKVAALDGQDELPPAPRASAKQPPARGLMVPRARVEQAVQAGHRPSGSPVAATDRRPRGMALSNVAGFGVGLRDGDVVTRVGGTPATSVGAVTSAVRVALSKGQPAIVAEVWRGHHRIIVTIELPLTAE